MKYFVYRLHQLNFLKQELLVKLQNSYDKVFILIFIELFLGYIVYKYFNLKYTKLKNLMRIFSSMSNK